MLNLCKGEQKLEILKTVVADEPIISELTEKFNPAVEFTEKEMVSMLYYLGYLTIKGRIDRIVEVLGQYLKNLSNRDMIKFDEKYVKLIFYCIVMNLKSYQIKSEMEVNKNYPDLVLIPRDRTQGYNSIMIEFKYLKKEDNAKLEEKQKEAREQIERYSEFDEMKNIEGLHKYTIVVVNDEIYVEEIKN